VPRDQLTLRLVVYEDAARDWLRELDGSAIHRDVIARRGAIAKLRDPPAEGYAAGFNPGFDFPPRAQPGGG
jgi:hypothetical protein